MADRRLVRILVSAVVVLMLAVGYLVARLQNQREIARVEGVAHRLERERDSIQALVAANSVVRESLALSRADTEAEVEALRDHVELLEHQRQASALTVRSIRKTSALQARLDSTFPEMAHSNWGVTTIPFEPGDTLGIEYFVIPAWFTETFIIDHENAESWRQQKDKMLVVDSLQGLVIALQDSIATLLTQNTLALQTGYEHASNDFHDLSTRYIAELRKPRFSLGSTIGLTLGAAGAGVLIATLANR